MVARTSPIAMGVMEVSEFGYLLNMEEAGCLGGSCVGGKRKRSQERYRGLGPESWKNGEALSGDGDSLGFAFSPMTLEM